MSAVSALALGLAAPAATAAPAALAAAPDPDVPQLQQETATVAKSIEKGTVISLGKAGKKTYVIQLEDAAVPAYAGGVKGLKPVQAEGRSYRPEASRERAYRGHLESEQASLRSEIAGITGRSAEPLFSYTDALNGFAIELNRAEARQVADLDGVSAVQVDVKHELQTDRGPEWIGAPSIWDGTATPDNEGTKGEGVVVGIIDSGINPANPSFASSVDPADGGDGYEVQNPLGAGTYVGVCDPDSDVYIADWGCTDKLIGAWDLDPNDGTNPYDDDGHGSHTASTTAGNQLDATTYSTEADPAERFSATRNIKGVAPHANIIAYDVCSDGCPGSAILAGIEQAIDDQVDVINYSIGSSASPSPWNQADSIGFLNARAAGIHVATSAGNSGPGAETVGSPANAPWMTSVGATTHDRQWRATVQDLAADGDATHPDITGLAFANATDGTFPLVDAADAGDELCREGNLDAATVAGAIVVCTRGVTGRVQKGEVVADLGAAGMILANDAASGDSLNADPHALPAVHITYDDGEDLKAWMASVTNPVASLSGGQEYIGSDIADTMAAFSSRGPNRSMDIISPSISAPGVDILAAEGHDNEVVWGFISGTSMASPHIAGSLALLDAANPDWTPAEAQSALMTTAVTEVTDSDGTPADWFDMGSGRVDLTKASDAGLVLDITEADYLAANPAEGGDPKELNLPSMDSSDCVQVCTWTRTVTATSTGAGTWTAAGSAVTDGIDVSVSPESFTLAEGETAEITVTADVSGQAVDAYQFGSVVLTPPDGSDAPAAHLPVAAMPSNGAVPASIDVDTRRDAGSQESGEITAVEVTALDVQAAGLVPAEQTEVSMPQDETNDDPFDGNGSQQIDLTVPVGATRLVVNLQDATAPDFDLFVGYGDTPGDATLVAYSASGGSDEGIDIPLYEGDEGAWWILVQNWEASDADTDTVTVEHAVVAGDEGNLTVEGPATQPGGEPFTVRAFWDEPAMEAGQTWYGSISLASAAGGTDLGTIPVTINRLADDVTKTADVETAGPGDTITYTVEVQPNVTSEDLEYAFEDTLSEGTTYVEGSGPEGVTVEDGVLTWGTTMPTPVGAEGDYTVTTSADDESCVNPLLGEAGYFDLFNVDDFRFPGVTGDGTSWTAFTDMELGFYEDSYTGMTFTDDGFLVYGEDNYGGSPFVNQSLPDTALPNNVAAMLWQDMVVTYDASTKAGVSLASAGDLAIAQFDDMRLFRDPDGELGTYDYQVFQIDGSRDVVVAFGDLDGPLGNVTIGAENGSGEKGTALVNAGDAAGVIEPGTVVCMTYGNSFPAKTFTYQVTVDDDVADGAVLTNTLVDSVDAIGAEPVTHTTDVTVVGGVQPMPDTPIRIVKKRDAIEPSVNGIVQFRRPAWSVGKRLVVRYAVRGTAKPGRDYRRLDGVVVFGKNQRIAREVVRIINRPGKQKTKVVRMITLDTPGIEPLDPRFVRVKLKDRSKR
ncbi:MAG: hypothetical protein CMH83_04565 [Nocardioides sp.]|nr:hypothetical protein [Nocardioides sp.]